MKEVDNICIPDSYRISKKDFDSVLDEIEEEKPSAVFKYRSRKSLKLEWATHNGLYNLGLWRSRTKDVDLEYPQSWYHKIIYWILGNLFWLFIK